MWVGAVEELIGRPIRSKQREVMEELLQRNHVFATLPTAYGKSTCFGTFPAAFKKLYPEQDAIVLVISPLNALSASQDQSWKERGVSSIVLRPEMDKDEESMKAVKAGSYQLIFASPEIIQKDLWWSIIKHLREQIRLLVLDEVHCLSRWGKTFRPEYLRAVHLRAILPRAVTLALTATATPEIVLDVSKRLGLENRMVSVSLSPDRPEIFLKVGPASINMAESLAWYAELILQKQEEAPRAIIYASTIEKCTEIYVYFDGYLEDFAVQDGNYEDLNCRFLEMYHGSTDKESQERVVTNFRNQKSPLRCVVATIAFGLGVDIPDVRFVLHWGPAKTALSFWQEVGRASRDGKYGEAITYVYPSSKRYIKPSMHAIVDSATDTAVCLREKVMSLLEVSGQELTERQNMCCYNCTERARLLARGSSNETDKL